jgi:hypothetical protein
MVNQSFIPGATQPFGSQDVTVDATHIYWADDRAGTIGRANRDGTGVDPNFITGLLTSHARSLIVTIARHPGKRGGRRRAHLLDRLRDRDDRARQPGRQPRPPKVHHRRRQPVGVAVDAGHVYWTNNPDRRDRAGQPRRHGREPDLHRRLGSGVLASGGMAVDAAHVYWTNGQTIGRANLDGTTADPTFITGAGVPGDVDVDAGHVYWSNQDTLTPTGQVSGSDAPTSTARG